MSYVNKILFLTTGLLVFRIPLSSALTLEEVVASTKNHPRIEEAHWEAQAAKSRRMAGSWLNDPKLGIEFQEVPVRDRTLGNADMTNYSVSQEIPFPTTLLMRRSVLNADYRARKAMATGVARFVVFEAKKTFFELVANQKLLEAKKSIKAAYRPMVAALESRYQSSITAMQGRTSVLPDVLMSRMKYAEVEAEIHDLHHEHYALEAKLNLLMGRAPGTPIAHLVIPAFKSLKDSEERLKTKLLSQNSELKARKWEAAKAARETGLAAQNLIPTVEPEFAYNKRRYQENAYTVGINLNFPLWGHRNAAEISAARSSQKAALAKLEADRKDKLTEFYYLWNHAVWHRKVIQKYEDEIVPLARSAVKTSQIDFSTSLIPPSVFLQYIVQYHQAVSMYWAMWLDYQSEYALLEQLVGEEL